MDEEKVSDVSACSTDTKVFTRETIHCEEFKMKKKDREDCMELCPHQCVEMERCESKELDVEIRNLIGKSNTLESCEDPKPLAQERLSPQRTLCSLKSHSEGKAPGRLGCTWAGGSDMEAPAEPLQSRRTLLSKKKPLSSNSLEQQILTLERQRQELLEVNKQWDHQFRSMKQLYEKQLAEMKARLDVSEIRVSELEQERHQQHPEEERWRVLGRERLLQEKKDTEVLSEVLHEMKEENRLLKQKNASMTRRKEYYESEISRLNKALLDTLKKQHPPVVGTPPGKGDRNSTEEMRTQLEVLKQQVQIYEEDFRKERSDRERLNEEKEALQKINERLQSQLSKLSSQTKDLPAQPERPSYPAPLFLSPCVSYGGCGMVLHCPDPRAHPVSHMVQQRSPDYQWYVPDQLPPDVQHKANDSFLEKGAHR
ncbi:TNFAIP3-interacting protein 3 isoform X1 [Vidua macroura]|uniref:TNFAIP3-interacting protein 3 isoform X1 n=2 Tax=Vidua macroura TaxID=187451 RepID=UPI0023A812C0|nr:TNFAIP3-interacting protein 3 isoform X1 [Vidua macroura]